MKKLSILGSTGSIGKQALSVVDLNRSEFEIVGLAEGHDVKLLAEQIKRYSPQIVSVKNEESASDLKKYLSGNAPIVRCGIDGAAEVASFGDSDLVLSAMVGAIGLIPTLAAINSGKNIALANKETLVAGGPLVMREVRKNNIKLIPVDSEHSAIFQSLQGHNANDVSKLILTASGGPFRNLSITDIESVTLEKALKHPNWSMGAKITIDSATLMNKGLEVIEARWLFDVPASSIEVVVHPQSIVHSMVEYKDGSVIAQLGLPNMQTPIAYALGYPNRIVSGIEPPSFYEINELNFERPDNERFPSLNLAYEALGAGESMPAVLNAANEIAVEAFLNNQISFTNIPEIVEKVMNDHDAKKLESLDDVLECDQFGRRKAKKLIGG